VGGAEGAESLKPKERGHKGGKIAGMTTRSISILLGGEVGKRSLRKRLAPPKSDRPAILGTRRVLEGRQSK